MKRYRMPFCLSSESRYSRLYCAAYLMEGMLRTSMMQFILWDDRNFRNLLRGCMECPIVKQCNCFICLNPENAIAFSYKRNLWPNTASKLAVQILIYLKQYALFCPASFSLSLAQILRLTRKIKTKCIFRVEG